jgi:hypothetical protein
METLQAHKTFFEKNTHLLNHPVNVTFDELLEMDADDFRKWVINMRKAVVDIWDNMGCPPRIGKVEEDIIEEWNKMAEYPVKSFEFDDELENIGKDVILNKARLGSEVDQWFPTMMKTRINYSEKDDGYSIYELFAEDRFLDRMVKGSMRHFRRDSLYMHALSCLRNNAKPSLVSVPDALSWIKAFQTNKEIFKGYDFMLEQVKVREGNNTGYFQLNQSDILNLTREQVQHLKDEGVLQYRHFSTFDVNSMPDDRVYTIRIYKKGERVFPKGFAAFRIGYIQVAHNFPPMTAKYLYERFTEHVKGQKDPIVIYDPSSGWGGRILGAMSVRDDRKIHYIGTDPNPELYYIDTDTGEERPRYADVADFYNTKTYRGNPFFSETNTYEIYRLGSEEIGNNPRFKKYRGKIDMIFTSPPYFNREAYSKDENQSYKKYGSSYESWRDGFLRPTLKTCAEFLKPDRYLLWNIADIQVGGDYLPLEEDSKRFLEEFGLVYKYKVKMAMESMPGQNRLDEETGLPKCKNYCKVGGDYMKYEPVYVFYKPKGE